MITIVGGNITNIIRGGRASKSKKKGVNVNNQSPNIQKKKGGYKILHEVVSGFSILSSTIKKGISNKQQHGDQG